MSGVGITSYGTYVPQFRLERTPAAWPATTRTP
jgi:hypothetical protein